MQDNPKSINDLSIIEQISATLLAIDFVPLIAVLIHIHQLAEPSFKDFGDYFPFSFFLILPIILAYIIYAMLAITFFSPIIYFFYATVSLTYSSNEIFTRTTISSALAGC